MARVKPMTKTSVSFLKRYLDEQMEQAAQKGELCKISLEGHTPGVVPFSESKTEITEEDLQRVSMDDNMSLTVAVGKPGAYRYLGYSGSHADSIIDQPVAGSVDRVYMDELFEKYAGEPQPQAQTQKQSESVIQMKGVSRNCFRFRERNGEETVNVSVPWAASKNGLGYLDIPREDFYQANHLTDVEKAKLLEGDTKAGAKQAAAVRSSYVIPLSQPEYGLWYVDKATGKATKPSVASETLVESYEANRKAYNRQKGADVKPVEKETPKPEVPVSEPKADAASKQESAQPKQTAPTKEQLANRPLPDIQYEESNPEMDLFFG